MSMFRIVTPLIYWALIVLWLFIFIFYTRRFLSLKNSERFLKVLIIILAIDAFRTLFESFYFGAWFTSLSEIIPLSVYDYLSQPQVVFIPKIINLIVSVLILFIIIKRWLPEEAVRFDNVKKQLNKSTEDLKESEEYNRTLFAQSTIGLALTTMDGNIVDVNSAYAEIIGRSVDESKKLTYWEITPEKYSEQEKIQLEQLNTIGEYGPYEKEYIHKKGHLVPVRLQGKIIVQKGVKYIWSSVEDITASKKTQIETIENEELFRSIFEQSASGMCLTGLDGKFIKVNESFCEMLNYSCEELVGKHFNSITFPDDVNIGNDLVFQMIEGKSKRAAFEKRYQNKSGETIWARINSVLVRDDKSKPNYFITQIEDITHRVSSDLKLKKNESRMQSIFNASPIGIGIINNRIIIKVNNEFCKIVGYTEKELIGQSTEMLYPTKEDFELMGGKEYDQSKSYTLRSDEIRIKRKDGQIIYTLVNTSPLNPDNIFEGLTFTVLDITDRKNNVEKLKENVQVFTQAEKVAKIGSWKLDVSTLKVTWSNEIYDIFGISPDFVGNVMEMGIEHIHPEDKEKILKDFNQSFEALQPYKLQYRIIVPGNIEKTIFNIGEPFKNEKGDVVSYVGIIQDISEQVKAEEAIHASEQRLRLFVKHSPASIAMFDNEMKYIIASHRYLVDYKLNEQELAGKSHYDIFTDIPDDWRKIYQRCLAGETIRADRDPFPRSDGKTDYVRWEIRPWYFTNDKIGGIILFSEVITDRIEDELEIKKANEELLTINRIINLCTGVLNLQEILDKVLVEAIKIVGLEGGTLCLVEPDDTLKLVSQIETSDATLKDFAEHKIRVGDCLCGTCAHDNCPLILHNREQVLDFSTREALRGEDIRFHAAFPLSSKEKCVGVLCVFTRTDKKPDSRSLKLLETITFQVALAIENNLVFEELEQRVISRTFELENKGKELADIQAALLNMVEDLNEKTDLLEQSTIKLEAANNDLKDFAYVVSHDLKAPLRAISQLSYWVYNDYKDVLDDEGKEQLLLITSRVKRMDALIKGILEYSRIGRIKTEKTWINTNEIVNETIESLLLPKNISVIFENNLPNINGDDTRVSQVFQNLIGNAIKFMDKPKGEIKIAVSDENKFWKFSIQDNGPGIEEKYYEKIFKIFQTLQSRDTLESTGIGLTLVKKIIHSNGGEIWVESIFGKETTFYFTWPKAESF